ncbi:baseplate J/gp47 family protein [Salinivibrio sp. KP-1]|uniref:baseplate J/gp47 family protein n=1 Tax=Salinivibrio sp. KP-1 TaxID=1406902 RepID=UPI0006145687|nr:baseplate J/gp47 family protein [Salinivibrio sp. KP-1]KKA45157.1 phage protein [Salinivibrio sp. KP-1]
MADIPKPDYKKIVKEAGIPTDAKAWRKVLQDEMEKAGSTINNDSRFSPFWRMIEQAVIVCTTWLINTLLVGYILPNMFLATSTGEWLKMMAWAVRIKPKPAFKARGKVVFQRAAAKGPALIIPKDTWVQTEPINGTIYRVRVTEDVTLPEDQQTISAPVEAEHAGAAYNLGGGYYHILPESVNGIGAVTNTDDWLDDAGADEESDDELRLRVRNQWSAVAKWHIDAAYRSLLMEKAGIQDDNIYFEHNAPRGPGTANAYILLDTGDPSPDMLTMLNKHIQDNGQRGHGDDLLIKALPKTDTDVRVTVWPEPELTDDERIKLKANIEQLIHCAFRENTDFDVTRTEPLSRFSFSMLGKELHANFTGIQSLDFENSDIITAMNVPRIRTLEVTIAST